MQAETLIKPNKASILMQRAIWLVAYCNRYNPRYNKILEHLRHSQRRAGGPAMRLANAVWAFNARLRFPRENLLKVAEENAYAHLCHNHRSSAKAARTHVWEAIELFCDMRYKVYGDPLMATIEEPPVETLNLLQDTLQELDNLYYGSKQLVKRNPVVRDALYAIALANPQPTPLLMAAIRATHTYLIWLNNTTSGTAFESFQQATNEALHQQYHNRAYLQNQAPLLGSAITSLGRALRQPPS